MTKLQDALSPAILALLVLAAATIPAADWPQYRGDAGRTGYSPDELPANPAVLWSRLELEPQPAWPRSGRMRFDHAAQPVVARGVLVFGSSADGVVRALDAATGKQLWKRFTDAPVRVAPACLGERVFVGSDDGTLYCFAMERGQLLWQRRAGPSGAKVLGNEHIVSRWPVRGGLLVADDRLYCGAGIWPSEGVLIQCLDPVTGDVVWLNDDSGSIYMPQPHGGANARSGVAAQGHLVASGDLLLLPTGRAVPAAFERADGKLRYFHLQKHGHRGGADVAAIGPWYWSGGLPFDSATGELEKGLRAGLVAATPEGLVHHDGNRLAAYVWGEREAVDRKGDSTSRPMLKPAVMLPAASGADAPTPKPPVEVGPATTLIVCGSTAVIGGTGSVSGYALPECEPRWSVEVEGTVFGLAAADGRIFASTDRGLISCIGAADDGSPTISVPTIVSRYGANEPYRRAAAEILAETGAQIGYCVDLGAGDGALAYSIARLSDLRVYAIEPDPELARVARERLADAGLYGTRVTVHQLPLEDTGYPRAFANLVVSRRSVDGATEQVPADALERWARPYGGVVCFGKPGSLETRRRGALPGAGSWTHQYADASNTVCSGDDIVEGDLELSWYRDVDQAVPQRHGRGPAPLFSAGRIFSEGLDSLVAVDAYNGTVLWEYPLPGILKAYDGDHLMGTAGSGSNFCVGGDSVFVRQGAECLQIDVASGVLERRFRAPDLNGETAERWGYVATEGRVLFGSVANPDHVVTYRYLKGGDLAGQLTESGSLFAFDRVNGKLLWHRQADHSFRHNAIAIGGGRVYVVDRPLALFDRRRESKPEDRQEPGALHAFDARTGWLLWKREPAFGTLLAVSVPHDALLECYQDTRFKLASELGKRLRVRRASTGEILWEKGDVSYASRPLIVDRTIYAQGGAWDLLTGEPRPFNFSRSYGCGTIAGGKRMLVYRSATLGYFDLKYNTENRDFGGVRPGCWINAIPAGGMVLMPDASSGCRCSYLNQSWIGLRPRRAPAPSESTPIASPPSTGQSQSSP